MTHECTAWYVRRVVAACISAGAVSCALRLAVENHHEHEIGEEMQSMLDDWRAGRVLESLEVPVLDQSLCVDIVRDERNVKIGLVELETPHAEVAVRVDRMVEVRRWSDRVHVVTVRKPFAWRASPCGPRR